MSMVIFKTMQGQWMQIPAVYQRKISKSLPDFWESAGVLRTGLRRVGQIFSLRNCCIYRRNSVSVILLRRAFSKMPCFCSQILFFLPKCRFQLRNSIFPLCFFPNLAIAFLASLSSFIHCAVLLSSSGGSQSFSSRLNVSSSLSILSL